MLTLCQAVQAPLKPEKIFSPATLMMILGIELDSITMQARLPKEKLDSLLEELHSFSILHSTSHTCTKRQFLSLIGKLAFACEVIPAGRIFLRRLLDTVHSKEGLNDITISEDALQDILWWQRFAEPWNGRAFFNLDTCSRVSALHGCFRDTGVRWILARCMVQSAMATPPRQQTH